MTDVIGQNIFYVNNCYTNWYLLSRALIIHSQADNRKHTRTNLWYTKYSDSDGQKYISKFTDLTLNIRANRKYPKRGSHVFPDETMLSHEIHETRL